MPLTKCMLTPYMPLSTSGQAENATKEKEKIAHQKARQHTAEWFHLIGINAEYFSKFACAAFREYIDDKVCTYVWIFSKIAIQIVLNASVISQAT